MTPDPDRKPGREDRRQVGRLAVVVLVFMGLFTAVFIWLAG